MQFKQLIRQGAAVLAVALGAAGHAQAANVAFWSDSRSPSNFSAFGAAHTVTQVTSANIDAGALSAYDVLVMGSRSRNDVRLIPGRCRPTTCW